MWQPPSYILSFDCSNSWRQMLSQEAAHMFLGIFHTVASQRIPDFQYHFVCFMNLYNLYGCTLSPVPHPFLLLPYPPISVTSCILCMSVYNHFPPIYCLYILPVYIFFVNFCFPLCRASYTINLPLYQLFCSGLHIQRFDQSDRNCSYSFVSNLCPFVHSYV